ncbi:MAG: flagellar export protein FliJ [Firmicutes bacterium]|nr:flagellar export protein FliJ [Bacillota bacterium]
MAGFKFRLQSYLNVKEKIEDQKKLDYGKALNKLEEEKKEKVLLENEKNMNIHKFRESIESGIKPLELQNYNNYIEYMKKKIAEQDIVIDIAKQNVEKCRTELVEAMKNRKMLETLKDKDREEYNKEQLLAEQKIVDEIVSYQYNDGG